MSAVKSPIPVLPLRDIVVFPNMIVRLFVGREKSVFALEEVMKTEQQILLVAQKDAGDDNPGENNIFKVGVIANVLQVLKLPDGAVKILIEGKHRVKISEFLSSIPLDKIVLETDSPYLAPVPYRGKRNESSFLQIIASKIAEIYNIHFDEVSSVTEQNSIKIKYKKNNYKS